MHGGKVIGEGGYGIVNHPAIKCTDKDPDFKTETVSKAMRKKDAIFEYNIAKIIESQVQPEDLKKYFVFPVREPCPITTLSKEDITISTKKNTRIDKTKFKDKWLLHLPYHGINCRDYVYNILNKLTTENAAYTMQNLQFLKEKILTAFKEGLLPLNKKGIFHRDLKLDNILIDNEQNVRFNDWGMSIVPLTMIVSDNIFTGSGTETETTNSDYIENITERVKNLMTDYPY